MSRRKEDFIHTRNPPVLVSRSVRDLSDRGQPQHPDLPQHPADAPIANDNRTKGASQRPQQRRALRIAGRDGLDPPGAATQAPPTESAGTSPVGISPSGRDRLHSLVIGADMSDPDYIAAWDITAAVIPMTAGVIPLLIPQSQCLRVDQRHAFDLCLLSHRL